jgi:hypothetical protein
MPGVSWFGPTDAQAPSARRGTQLSKRRVAEWGGMGAPSKSTFFLHASDYLQNFFRSERRQSQTYNLRETWHAPTAD